MDIVFFLVFLRKFIAIGKFPGRQVGRRIILDMLHIAPPLQYQGLQSFFGQFFGRPASGDAGTYHDGVICIFVFFRHEDRCF